MTTTKHAPSEKAFSYALSLYQDFFDLAEVSPDARVSTLLHLAGMDADMISKTIDGMIPIVADLKKKAFKPAVLAYVPPAGQYLVNGTHYTLKKSKIHGGILVYSDGGYGYVGSLAAPKCSAIAEALNTADKAKAAVLAYAKETGKCGVCNTTLTDPKSIAAGIGPVCAKKY